MFEITFIRSLLYLIWSLVHISNNKYSLISSIKNNEIKLSKIIKEKIIRGQDFASKNKQPITINQSNRRGKITPNVQGRQSQLFFCAMIVQGRWQNSLFYATVFRVEQFLLTNNYVEMTVEQLLLCNDYFLGRQNNSFFI